MVDIILIKQIAMKKLLLILYMQMKKQNINMKVEIQLLYIKEKNIL